jgi:hypothetical protein
MTRRTKFRPDQRKTKTSICAVCQGKITLAQTGTNTWKWVTDPAKPNASWRCGRDPDWPVRGHDPDPTTFAHTKGKEPWPKY